MKQETEIGKYKFDRFGVCKNPSTYFRFQGSCLSFSILTAVRPPGHIAGYEIWYNKIEDQDQVVSTSMIPSVNAIYNKQADAIMEAGKLMFQEIAQYLNDPGYEELMKDLIFINDYLIQFGLTENLINNLKNNEMQTATSKPVIIPEAKFENIPLGKIIVDTNQPRTFFDQHAMDELTDSVREKGVLQPILVRPTGNGKNYMIVCGERRYKASISVNAAFKDRNSIPAVIRSITDDEALELQIIENLQRKDVHPMEEAVAFKSLVEHGKDLKEIAAKIGKSEFYARQRMKLNSLTENWQTAFFKGRISNAAALSIALFDNKIQEEIYKSNAAGSGNIELSNWDLRRYRGDLSTAPFDLSDATLDKKMGPCINCKFNSATAALFETSDAAKCSNIVCFKGKCDTHFIRAFDAAMQDATILFVHTSWGSYQDKFTERLKKADIPFYGSNDYDKVDAPDQPDWEDWKEDNESDYDVSEAELRAIFEKEEVESYSKDLIEYQTKIESGKYKKAFMLEGSERGMFVYITLKKKSGSSPSKSKSKGPVDQVTAEDISIEIDRINGREKRNQELDIEKVHVAMLLTLQKADGLKQPGIPMQAIDRGIMIYLLLKAGGYNFEKVTTKLPGFPVMPDTYKTKYKFTPEYFTKLSLVSDDHLAFIIRKLAFEKLGTKNVGMGIHFDDTIPRLLAGYMGVDVSGLEKEQKAISDVRYEKVSKRISSLTRQRQELKKPAKKPTGK